MRRWSSHIKCPRFTLYSTIYSTVYRPAKYQRVPCFVLSSLLYFLMPMSIWKIWVDKSKEKSKVSKPNHDVGDGLLGGAGWRRRSRAEEVEQQQEEEEEEEGARPQISRQSRPNISQGETRPLQSNLRENLHPIFELLATCWNLDQYPQTTVFHRCYWMLMAWLWNWRHFWETPDNKEWHWIALAILAMFVKEKEKHWTL